MSNINFQGCAIFSVLRKRNLSQKKRKEKANKQSMEVNDKDFLVLMIKIHKNDARHHLNRRQTREKLNFISHESQSKSQPPQAAATTTKQLLF